MDGNHISIEHSLGRDRAKDRLIKGMAAMRKDLGEKASMTEDWTGPYEVDVALQFLGTQAMGRAEVTDTAIELNLVRLPLILRPFKGQVAGYIEKHGPAFFAKA